MTTLTDDQIWERRRDQPHPPTPGNPAFSVKDLKEAQKAKDSE